MRINVYSQELEKEVVLVEKGEHKGVRIFFDGSPRLLNTPDDDDRSAITYWLPNNHAGPSDLERVFAHAAALCRVIADQEEKRRLFPSEPHPSCQ